jgi:uncharacterized 2Fe-2S/4Fe-4S cluster protein (DUF4445 family)
VGGAIEHAWIADEHFHVETIDGATPLGMCGSGLIDVVAASLQHGLIFPSGRLAPTPEQGLRGCLRRGPTGPEIVIADDPRVTMHQQDVRQIQLAVAAVRTGVEALLSEAGLTAGDIAAVHLAGGFGTHLRAESLETLGVLPLGLADRVEPVGNVAGLGALLAVGSAETLRRSRDLARRVRYLPLEARPGFQESFTRSLRFPDPGR